MRICLELEGCYPYVHGGVSTWMHGYIQAMPEHEFVLWVIGAHTADRGKFVYELPGNVVEVHEVFLDDALRLSGEQHEASFNDCEREALSRLVSLSNPDWDVLFDIFHRRRVHPLSFLQSRTFMDIFRDVCLAEYPYTPFADAFHTSAPCCCPCSTCWAARCRWPMCTMPSRPATVACSPAWAQAFTMRRCC